VKPGGAEGRDGERRQHGVRQRDEVDRRIDDADLEPLVARVAVGHHHDFHQQVVGQDEHEPAEDDARRLGAGKLDVRRRPPQGDEQERCAGDRDAVGAR